MLVFIWFMASGSLELFYLFISITISRSSTESPRNTDAHPTLLKRLYEMSPFCQKKYDMGDISVVYIGQWLRVGGHRGMIRLLSSGLLI